MIESEDVRARSEVCADARYVYIYADDGASETSVRGWQIVLCHAIHYPPTHIRLTYAHTLIPDITAQAPDRTAVIFPGGADLPYMEKLRGARIGTLRAVIAAGASYIGTCAGAYFASSFCIFEPRDAALRVVSPRPLCLFGRPAIGAVSPGFHYHSERGATTEFLACAWHGRAFQTHAYCNGGPAWALVEDDARTRVIARYTRPVLSRNGVHEPSPAAVLLHAFGHGVAVLSGVHPEIVAKTPVDVGLGELLLAIGKGARLLE